MTNPADHPGDHDWHPRTTGWICQAGDQPHRIDYDATHPFEADVTEAGVAFVFGRTGGYVPCRRCPADRTHPIHSTPHERKES